MNPVTCLLAAIVVWTVFSAIDASRCATGCDGCAGRVPMCVFIVIAAIGAGWILEVTP